MIVLSLLRWWYSEGLLGQLKTAQRRVEAMADYFSIALLLKTLFSPFRQISATKVDGPLGVRWRAWLDKLISRCVGAVFRLFTIIAGLVTLCVTLIVNIIVVVGWALMPLLPLIGLTVSLSGWVPWTK